MDVFELYQKARKIYEAIKDDYDRVGIRFENKDRAVGETCDWSRHNPYRDDERDFPDYESDEYAELPVLDGTSAWDLRLLDDDYFPGFGDTRRLTWIKPGNDVRNYVLAQHCYIIAGNDPGRHDDPDEGEILIRDAVVIAKLF